MKKSALLLLPFLLCSCASIVTGSKQSISVESEPSGAECKLTNDKGEWWVNQTPGSVVIERSYSDLNVNCRKDKFSGLQSIKSHTKGAAFGNILLGGVIGAGVDMSTGAAYDYPSSIFIELKK